MRVQRQRPLPGLLLLVALLLAASSGPSRVAATAVDHAVGPSAPTLNDAAHTSESSPIRSPESSPRIINGELALPNQFEYFALVQKTNGDHCGGALITNLTVVTAAHCIEKRDGMGALLDLRPLLSKVRIGCTALSDRAGTRWCQERQIAHIVVHPEWDGNLGTQAKDIAVLTLDAPVKMRPVLLADSAQPLEQAEVMGYGQTGAGTSMDTLRYTSQYIENVDGSSLITVADESGPCYGDSGSPLVTKQGLVGLVSYGTGACDSFDDTDGYFYVPSVRAWVDLMKTFASHDSAGTSPIPRPPTDAPPAKPALGLEDGVYALQVVSFGPCRGKFLAASVRGNSCEDRTLRLYSSATVKSVVKKKKSGNGNGSKKKGKRGGVHKGEKKTKKNGRSLLAAETWPSLRSSNPSLRASSKTRMKSAALWKIATKPSDKTVYLESTARSTCVSPFIQMLSTGSTSLGPINQGWILEKYGSKYVRLLNADTYKYMSTFTKRCSLKASPTSSSGTQLKFRIVA